MPKLFRKEGSTTDGEEFSIQHVVRCVLRGKQAVADFGRFLDENKLIPIFTIIRSPTHFDALFWIQDDKVLGEFELGFYRDSEPTPDA